MKANRTILFSALLCLAASASAADEPDLRMNLTIDDAEVGKVATGADVRGALAKCNPPKTCSYVGLNREPQIDFAAVYEGGGYTIGHRTGPPGPEFEANRKGRGDLTHFSTAEMIGITSDYIDGRNSTLVGWKASALAQATTQCEPPSLTADYSDAGFAAAFAEGSANLAKVKANLAAAHESACARGLLKDMPLPALVLFNAPDANIASIYDRDGRKVLEYPFLASDGSTNIPNAEDIEEAIYCAAVGATEAEQEESGRCLPD